MSFPKTMRWADGRAPLGAARALAASRCTASGALPLELFGVRVRRIAPWAIASSASERVARRRTPTATPTRSRDAYVVVDPAERRERSARRRSPQARAQELGGEPGRGRPRCSKRSSTSWSGRASSPGRFDARVPRRCRASCSSPRCAITRSASRVRTPDGELLPRFLAVANTDRDPARPRAARQRVGRRRPPRGRALLLERGPARRARRARRRARRASSSTRSSGTYADKAERHRRAGARSLASRRARGRGRSRPRAMARGWPRTTSSTGSSASSPSCRGVVGGLLLRARGAPSRRRARGLRALPPGGAGRRDPASASAGSVVSVADKLDTMAAACSRPASSPTGSRDPFGLRRAANGVFRIVDRARVAAVARASSDALGGGRSACRRSWTSACVAPLRESRVHTERDPGRAPAPRQRDRDCLSWHAATTSRARLEAIRTVRGREDFEQLVELTEARGQHPDQERGEVRRAARRSGSTRATARRCRRRGRAGRAASSVREPEIAAFGCATRATAVVIAALAEFIEPVERFFAEVLVIDPSDPRRPCTGGELLARLRDDPDALLRHP